jgi:acyl carrier protein
MTDSNFLYLVDDLLELPPGTVKAGDSLEGLEGWDSLAVISFMALVDEHFSVRLQPRKITACKTVADLVAMLGDRVTVEATA